MLSKIVNVQEERVVRNMIPLFFCNNGFSIFAKCGKGENRITSKMKAQDNVFRMRIVSTKTAICNWIINLTEYIRIETTSDPSIIELLCYRARCIIELYQKAQK